MHDSASPALFPGQLTTFRNTCGRPGCSHVFEFSGLNPLESISSLVSQHAVTCAGRSAGSATEKAVERDHTLRPHEIPDATPRVWRSQIPISMLVHGNEDADRNSRSPSPAWITSVSSSPCSRSSSLSDDNHPPRSPSPPSSISAHSGTTSSSSSPCSRSSSLPPLTAIRHPSAPPRPRSIPRTRRPRPHKKSAHTESQRRLILESDPYILPGSLTPREVVCGGCHRRIKLDQRSKYYPGLWEKHRGRCDLVQELMRRRQREVTGMEEAGWVPRQSCVLLLP
ncbi:hypothetical protein FB45DRAFT_1021644 [Roridomyces roridus]|uniref:Uncharacterized protein n=1 Tax=Roridomyces roridus TaxID=1738132 RepID=A0AAD7CCI0_9AGAR|nr:hypothetical protein FB45DRAFT_1021644 [Roridomyces roridus]